MNNAQVNHSSYAVTKTHHGLIFRTVRDREQMQVDLKNTIQCTTGENQKKKKQRQTKTIIIVVVVVVIIIITSSSSSLSPPPSSSSVPDIRNLVAKGTNKLLTLF